MMQRNRLLNIFKSKYFYLITLLSVWLLVQVFFFGVEKVPDRSLQLSSSTTVSAIAATLPSNGLEEASPSYYDLHLKLLSDTVVSHVVENAESQPEFKTVTLRKNSVVAVTVPSSLFGSVDPTRLSPSQIHLNDILSKLDSVKSDPPYNSRQEVTVIETPRRDKALRGETVRVDLRSLANKRVISFKKVEIVEDVDYGEGDEESDTSPVVSNDQKTNGTIPCLSSACLQPTLPKNSFDIIEMARNLLPKTKTLEEILADYDKSTQVKELLNAAATGYKAVRRKTGGKSYPVDGKVNRSIGACFNGVKALLSKAGWIDSPADLPEEHAKNAGTHLKKNGFVNLLENPEFAKKITNINEVPVGSVLVYEGHGGNRGKKRDPGYNSGHIEVKTRQGYMSDYFSPNPRTDGPLTGKYRKLIGVYIKSDSNMPNVLMAMSDKSKGSKNENFN